MKISLRKYGISGLEIMYEAFNVNVVDDVKVGVRELTKEDGTVVKFGADVRTDVLEMFMDITSELLNERVAHIDCDILATAVAERLNKNMGMQYSEAMPL